MNESESSKRNSSGGGSKMRNEQEMKLPETKLPREKLPREKLPETKPPREKLPREKLPDDSSWQRLMRLPILVAPDRIHRRLELSTGTSRCGSTVF